MPPIKRKKSEDKKEIIGTEIPNEFDRDWPGADIILKINDGNEEKRIYANKAILAYYSPTYFKPMFFHQFQEKSKKEIAININYGIFLNILRILHHIDYKKNLLMLAPATEVYKIAHEFDFPLIRAMLLRETEIMTPAQIYFYKKQLGIEMNRADELAKMDGDNIREFLETAEDELTFTLQETIAIARACGQHVYRDEAEENPAPRSCSNCGDAIPEKNQDGICPSCNETLATNFAIKWTENAVPIRLTGNQNGPESSADEIYIFAVFSRKFKEIHKKDSALSLPYSLGTMNWILNLLHHKINLDNYLNDFNPPVEHLGKIKEAAIDLEIAFIQAVCKEKEEHPTAQDKFIIQPTEEEIKAKKMRLTYNVVKDLYRRGEKNVNGYEKMTFDRENMYRKVEHDHRMAYLAREEDEEKGSITWAVDLTAVKVRSLTVEGMAGTLFHDGEFTSHLKSIEKERSFPDSGKITLNNPLSTFYKIIAKFSGGEDDTAWQYSQLFRTPLAKNEEEQLVIEVEFE